MNKYLEKLENGGDARSIILEMSDEIDKLKECDEELVCTEFNLKLSDMKYRKQERIQPPNGEIYTIILKSR